MLRSHGGFVMLKGTRAMIGQEAELYRRVTETLRRSVH